ncbi:hypothetical protein CHUAL_008099 [Chamberlinius hualienensis]
MHQTRRRKKRPSYGVRTIEIARGKNGFGFTISGQAPCILSCIAATSPAEASGLRPGDYLIAVNGQNVSKALHDDVVRMIGSCQGILKLQIAENYYSNSSDDEVTTTSARPRPRYPNRFRQRHQNHHSHHHSHHHHHHHHHHLNAFSHLNTANNSSSSLPDTCNQQQASIYSDNSDYKNITGVNSSQKNWLTGNNNSNNSNNNVNSSRKTATDSQSGEIKSWNALQQLPTAATTSSSCKYFEPLNNSVVSVNKSKYVGFQHHVDRKKAVAAPDRKDHRSEQERLWDAPEKENCQPLFSEHEINSMIYPSLQQLQCNSDTEEPIYKAVVGYLGTIEMPKEPHVPCHRLSAIRNCIRRLRVEKKVHTLVLLKVFGDRVTLINSHGANLAEFPTERITFCGAYADDKKFFGLVTTRNVAEELLAAAAREEEPTIKSSSCHVFMVDPKLLLHEEHLKRAKSFRFECTPDMGSGHGECCEFPETVDAILVAIVGLYRGRAGMPMDLDAHVSPQPSNTSSNSDSGIGFRDEGQNSDRVSIVDIDNDYGYVNPVAINNGPKPNLTPSWRCGLPLSGNAGGPSGLKPPIQVENCGEKSVDCIPVAKKCSVNGNKLTVRVMPDPVNSASSFMSTPKGPMKYFTNKMDEDKLNGLNFEAGSISPMLVSASSGPEVVQLAQVHGLCPQQQPYTGSQSSTTVTNTASDLMTETNSEIPAYNDCCGGNESDCGTTMLADDPAENICEQEEGSQDVNPPSQAEDSDGSGLENDAGSEYLRVSRSTSFRKHLKMRFGGHSKYSERVSNGCVMPVGDPMDVKCTRVNSAVSSELSMNMGNGNRCSSVIGGVGRTGCWAISFEKLLSDPAGLHTFAEFLKKEFSYENIAFWVACERFRRLTNAEEIKSYGKAIFYRHLSSEASEPVNVDSHARQKVDDGLSAPTTNLFLLPQKQIFNLMKFDSYARFLKSPLYQDCALKEAAGEPLPYLGDKNLDTDSTDNLKDYKKCKNKDDSEDRRRKSLLPWHRNKSGKSKKDKNNKKRDKKDDGVSSSRSDITGSRSSLASSDLPSAAQRQSSEEDGVSYCRILLPDQSTTIVSVKPNETIGSCLNRVLDRRGMCFSGYEAHFGNSEKEIDLEGDCTLINGQEIRIEERVTFQIELPNQKKFVSVKAKPNISLADALRPVLLKFGHPIDSVSVLQNGIGEKVDVTMLASAFDSNRLIIQKKNSGLRNGKAPLTNDSSDSTTETTWKAVDCSYTQENNSQGKNCTMKPPVAPTTQKKKDNEEMYHLWKRAQCSRLDDQRGTEINFELPEFLRVQSHMPEGRASEPVCSSRCKRDNCGGVSSKMSRLNSELPLSKTFVHLGEEMFVKNGIIPTADQAEDYFGGGSSIESGDVMVNSRRVDHSKLSAMRPCSHPPITGHQWGRMTECGLPSRKEMNVSVPGMTKVPTDASGKRILERSFSPSSVPMPNDIPNTSINADMADYSPPTPLKAKFTNGRPSSVFIRFPDEPPPLPPKPRPRRPVPLVPFVNSTKNDEFCEGDYNFRAHTNTKCGDQVTNSLYADKLSVSFV